MRQGAKPHCVRPGESSRNLNNNFPPSLENYAVLLRKTNRDAEAAKLEARAKAIRAKHAAKNPPK